MQNKELNLTFNIALPLVVKLIWVTFITGVVSYSANKHFEIQNILSNKSYIKSYIISIPMLFRRVLHALKDNTYVRHITIPGRSSEVPR